MHTPAGVSLFAIAATLPSVLTPGTAQRPSRSRQKTHARGSSPGSCAPRSPSVPRPRCPTDRRRLRPHRQYGVAGTLNVKATDIDLPPEKNRAFNGSTEQGGKGAKERFETERRTLKTAGAIPADMSVKPRFARGHASFLGFRARLWCTETPRPGPAGKNFFLLPSRRTQPARSANIQRERRVAQPRGCHFRTARVA